MQSLYVWELCESCIYYIRSLANADRRTVGKHSHCIRLWIGMDERNEGCVVHGTRIQTSSVFFAVIRNQTVLGYYVVQARVQAMINKHHRSSMYIRRKTGPAGCKPHLHVEVFLAVTVFGTRFVQLSRTMLRIGRLPTRPSTADQGPEPGSWAVAKTRPCRCVSSLSLRQYQR